MSLLPTLPGVMSDSLVLNIQERCCRHFSKDHSSEQINDSISTSRDFIMSLTLFGVLLKAPEMRRSPFTKDVSF